MTPRWEVLTLVGLVTAACQAPVEPAADTCVYTDTIPATGERPAVIVEGYYHGATCDSLRANFPLNTR